MSAPKNGLVALRIAAAEALMYCSAKQKSAKGNAEFTTPTMRYPRQCAESGGMERRASESAKSATKASATRENASHNGPSAGTATRMNANEPPQTAASNSNRAASPGAIDSVGAGVCPRAAAGLGDPECELATAGVGALVLEQPLLAPQPAAVPGQRAVGADHAVTGHDEAQA